MIEKMTNTAFLLLLRWHSASAEADYERIRQLSNVKILHFPYEKNLWDLLRSAKLVILPFRKTSAILPPMTIVEAMALGRCVMTTRLPGTDEILSDSNAVREIEPDDLAGTVQMARDLLRDEPERNRIGALAAKKMRALFSAQYSPFEKYFAENIGK